MRVLYRPLTANQFDVLHQRGGGLSDIRTYKFYHKRGGSLIGFLSNIARRSIPFLKQLLLPEIGDFAKNVTHDIASGEDMRSSLKRQGKQSLRNIIKKARGGRGKGKHVNKKTQVKRKRKTGKKRKRVRKRSTIFNIH
jgi:hypothetical protein